MQWVNRMRLDGSEKRLGGRELTPWCSVGVMGVLILLLAMIMLGGQQNLLHISLAPCSGCMRHPGYELSGMQAAAGLLTSCNRCNSQWQVNHPTLLLLFAVYDALVVSALLLLWSHDLTLLQRMH